MTQAIELARENVRAGKGGPFAALVVKDGSIAGCGTNLVVPENDPTAHAEIVAIRAACRALGSFQLTGCEIYTTCEPCPMCLGAIYWARPARVYYGSTRADAAAVGFDDAYIYEQLAATMASREIPMEQMLRDEALAAFRDWDAKRDKVRY
jgi:tRNA(Arg) A34 adenosine deaminase TadA